MEITITDSKIVAGAYKNRTDITSVTLADSVNVIDESAFEGCTALASITIGEGLTNIGASAFRGCIALTSISVPSELESIGDWAFRGCTALTEVVFEYRSASTDDEVKYVMDINYIGIGAFYGCTSLVYLENIGGGQLSSWSAYTFFNCTSFKGSRVISNVRKTKCVGHYAFYKCSSLEGLFTNLGEKAEIGNYAYYGSGIRSLDTTCELIIGDYAFCGCGELKEIKLYNVTHIGKEAFGTCYKMGNALLGQSLTFIGDGAFNNCRSLHYLHIPHGVLYIGPGTFENTGLGNTIGENSELVLDFSTHTEIPITTTDAIDDDNAYGILVPDELYHSWKTASGWSWYETNIYRRSLKGVIGATTLELIGKPRIRFNVHDKRFIAEEGMTWIEWCDSRYNNYVLPGETTHWGLNLHIKVDDRKYNGTQYTYTINWPCRDDVTSLYNDNIEHDIVIPEGYDIPEYSIPNMSIHPYEKIVDGTTYWSGLGYQVD